MSATRITIEGVEKAIQRALLDFVAATGCEIDSVRVDTRNFANLSVEILLKPGTASGRTREAAE